MPTLIDPLRRRILGAAIVAATAADLAPPIALAAGAEPGPGWPALRRVRTDVLEIAYADAVLDVARG